MESNKFSNPFKLQDIQIKDDFWFREMELVRKEVIPYQWDALNDKVPGASPSFCMHNFRAASKLVKSKNLKGSDFVAPKYTFRGFETLPEDSNNPDPDKFYGFVFQDTDFSKWIEAVAYSLSNHPDENLEAIADQAIDLVCSAQLENGYLDTYYIINGMDGAFKNLRDHHELYCLGHLIEGAVAYYQATGKDKLLTAASRFADYVYDLFGFDKDKCQGYPGHEIAEMALIRLYEVTGTEKYKELSNYFIEARGRQPYYFENQEEHDNETNEKYHQSHLPVRDQDQAVGHAVRAVYLYSGMADNARLYQDQSLFEACERLWDNIVNKKMYITGGIGSTHLGEAFTFEYDLPNDTAYAETCASIGMVFFARRMLQIKADSKYADIMELELYNGILSGMALDGKSFFYVNPLEVNPTACKEDERKFHVKPVRQKWFGCACCPPNIARLLSSLGSYISTENDDTLFLHLYMGATINKTFSGIPYGKTCKTTYKNNVSVDISSEMPWSGSSKIKVKSLSRNGRDKIRQNLALRIPNWTDLKYVRIALNDTPVIAKGKIVISDPAVSVKMEKGYLYISKDWEDDVIDIDFPMPIRVYSSNSNVRENFGKVAYKRGPIVYCAEEIDNGKNLYMLKICTEPMFSKTSLEDYLGHPSINLQVPGFKMVPANEDESEQKDAGLYNEFAKMMKEETTITLVPYYSWGNRGQGEMSVWLSI